MNKKFINWCASLLVVIMMTSSVCAKYYKIDSLTEFDRTLRKRQLVVAYFYRKKSAATAAQGQQMRTMRDELKTASKREPDVHVLGVNLDKKKNAEVAQAYNVGSVPTVLFFNNGMSIKKNGNDVRTTDYLNASQMLSLYDTYFADDLEKIREERARARRDRRWYGSRWYWGYGWGYGWPYYGYWWPHYGHYYGYGCW